VRASKRPDGTFLMVMSPTVPMVSRGRGIRSPPVGGFALLGHPRPHVGDGELQVLAEPVGGRAFAVHPPVVDGGDGQAEVGRQLADVQASQLTTKRPPEGERLVFVVCRADRI